MSGRSQAPCVEIFPLHQVVGDQIRQRCASGGIDTAFAQRSIGFQKPILHNVFGFTQDEAILEAASAMIEQTLDVLDARLDAEPYLAGEQFSLAGIVYLPHFDYLMATPLHAALSYRGNVYDREDVQGLDGG